MKMVPTLLGQNFKTFDEVATRRKKEYIMGVYQLIKTTHSDDAGLVSKTTPYQVVIVPIYKGDKQLKVVSDKH